MAGGLISDACADCDAAHPQWTSVNHGVLLCDDCSSVHRHLGRHISQVKHLTRSKWRPTQLAMVRQLAQSGANRFWEHLILAPSQGGVSSSGGGGSKKTSPGGGGGGTAYSRKPLPSDPVHTTKTEFIREKYLFQAFLKRPVQLSAEDLNQQLHASVRTGILESSLYLLALGADPNYIHSVRGTAPIHMASQNNQVGQVELLLTYGADLHLKDNQGNTALEVALHWSRQAALSQDSQGQQPASPLAWTPLLDSLVQARYELTDLLTHFLCRQTPDHRGPGINQHILVPGLPPDRVDASVFTMEARRRLQFLPNTAFVGLCVDVHDEIERRETNRCLNQPANGANLSDPAATAFTNDLRVTGPLCLLFLPPNKSYSSTRNQGRQKLARMGPVELNTLTLDLLTEARDRMMSVDIDDSSMRVLSSGERLSSLIASSVSHHHHRQSGLGLHTTPIPIPMPRVAVKPSGELPRPPSSGGRVVSSSARASSHRNSLPGLPCRDQEEDVYDNVAGDSEYACVLELGLLQTKDATAAAAAEEKKKKKSSSTGGGPTTVATVDSPTTTGTSNGAVCVTVTTTSVGTSTAQEEAEEEEGRRRRERGRVQEMAQLHARVEALDARNVALEERNKALEETTVRLERQLDAIKEEKETLLAAMCAGMVVSHPPSHSPTPTGTPPRRPGGPPPPSTPVEPLPQLPGGSGGGGSYSAGWAGQVSTGAELRQEVLRGPSSRDSPGPEVKPYTNLTPTLQKLLQQQHQVRQDLQHGHRPPAALPDSDNAPPDDYSRPSASGTPVDPSMLACFSVNEYDSPPPATAAAVLGPGGGGEGGPPGGGGGGDGMQHQQHEEMWPSSQRVVKSVEMVIRLIRALLETANASSAGSSGGAARTSSPHQHQQPQQQHLPSATDLVACSQHILSAVHALVAVFPAGQLRSRPHILSPLHGLVAGADQLRREAQRNLARSGPPTTGLIIQHSQEIAVAARQLLQRCQKSDC